MYNIVTMKKESKKMLESRKPGQEDNNGNNKEAC
jgi:hypothetical protein